MSEARYELEFEDTFDAAELDGRRWVPHRLPQWSSRERSAARYEVGRHTFATLMLEQGENSKVVQEALGHSRIAHTMDTYSHVSPNIQREAFGRLDDRLNET